ncbi:MAG: hypothetical protein A2Z18_05750 [Armatimonadetes bacterium RBG_16_58_9]|nr:MAG: hypothetical protein A2Z18_05750 [Armatimonadetes bacterium RBG_16_58_9]
MKAVILAAGKGTRMGDLTRNTPKPLIEIAGKPMIEHVIGYIVESGVSEFVLTTRYLSDKVRGCLGDGARLGARIQYVEQSGRYGTGAALLEARDIVGYDPVMMTFADIMTPAANYAGALATFREKGGVAVTTLNWVDDPSRGGAVEIDEDGRVCGIVEKPPKGQAPSNWNSAGIFVFEPIIFQYLEAIKPSPRGEYELPDAMNAMIDDGLAIYPYYLKGAWIDVGRPEDIHRAEEMLRREAAGAHSDS